MDDWTETRVGRAFHRLVVGPISHEEYRRMIRETYPAQLPPADSGWARRFGPEIKGQAVDIRFPSHPETAEMAATRRRLRALLDRYPGTWPPAPAHVHYDVASAEARQGRRGLLDSGPHAPRRKGRGICSGWADEEDYGPRYT